MDSLTTKQQKVYNFICHFIKSNEYPPTVNEIAKEMGFCSNNSAENHLSALERKGLIVRRHGIPRSIQLAKIKASA